MYTSIQGRYEQREVEDRPNRGGRKGKGRGQKDRQARERARSSSRNERVRYAQREKMSVTGRESSLARRTYRHNQHSGNRTHTDCTTTDDYTTETLAPHHIQTNSHTTDTFDRNELDNTHSTYTKQVALGRPVGKHSTHSRLAVGKPSKQLNNDYYYRSESGMEVNDVTAERNPPHTDYGYTRIPAQQAGEVFPKTSVRGNTSNSNEQMFSQSFLNRLARARQVEPIESRS